MNLNDKVNIEDYQSDLTDDRRPPHHLPNHMIPPSPLVAVKQYHVRPHHVEPLVYELQEENNEMVVEDFIGAQNLQNFHINQENADERSLGRDHENRAEVNNDINSNDKNSSKFNNNGYGSDILVPPTVSKNSCENVVADLDVSPVFGGIGNKTDFSGFQNFHVPLDFDFGYDSSTKFFDLTQDPTLVNKIRKFQVCDDYEFDDLKSSFKVTSELNLLQGSTKFNLTTEFDFDCNNKSY